MTHAELLAGHLAVVGSTPLPAGLEAIYHEGATMEFPFAPEGHTRRLDGREAIVAFFGRIPNFARDYGIVGAPRSNDIEGGFVARYGARSTFIESGRHYEQEYVAFIAVRDGRIAHITEYYDGQRVLRALGELE